MSMDFNGKKVLVFGSGISGVAAGQLLLSQGAQVILYDGNASLDGAMLRAELLEGAEGRFSLSEDKNELAGRVRVILGAFPEEELDSLALVVVSPGVPLDLPVVKQMYRMQIPVWGEIELAYVYGQGDVLAITGTNGKKACMWWETSATHMPVWPPRRSRNP